MGGGRERRAAKQRRRDARRGFAPGAEGGAVDRGLPPETLRRVLRETADDVAAGREEAMGELRLLLTEHLARRRREIVAACDAVLVEAGAEPVAAQGRSTEETVVATVHRLAGLT